MGFREAKCAVWCPKKAWDPEWQLMVGTTLGTPSPKWPTG
jgi:hypothetical protein